MLWRPLDKANLRDPYLMYKKLRAEAPIYKAHTGEWVVTGYEEVKAILKDNRFAVGNKKDWLERGVSYFDSKNIDFTPIADALNTFILLINPPDHTRIRKLVASAWDDKSIEGLIAENVNSLLEPLTEKKKFDVIEDFASHLPAMTIAGIMGIPLNDYLHLRDAGRDMIKAVNPYNTYKDFVLMNDAAKHFINYFEKLIEEKKAHPHNDLIGKIISSNRTVDKPLSKSQLISICIFLFIAGEETTIGFIGMSILTLAQYQLKDPDQLPAAVEELLRYNGPVHLLGRVAAEDFNFMGHKFKKDEVITICLASANRDEKQFKNADEFIASRSPNRHLAFGSGIHFCLGDWLAKKQATIALRCFINKFPSYTINETSISWSENLSIRSLKTLEVYTS